MASAAGPAVETSEEAAEAAEATVAAAAADSPTTAAKRLPPPPSTAQLQRLDQKCQNPSSSTSNSSNNNNKAAAAAASPLQGLPSLPEKHPSDRDRSRGGGPRQKPRTTRSPSSSRSTSSSSPKGSVSGRGLSDAARQCHRAHSNAHHVDHDNGDDRSSRNGAQKESDSEDGNGDDDDDDDDEVPLDSLRSSILQSGLGGPSSVRSSVAQRGHQQPDFVFDPRLGHPAAAFSAPGVFASPFARPSNAGRANTPGISRIPLSRCDSFSAAAAAAAATATNTHSQAPATTPGTPQRQLSFRLSTSMGQTGGSGGGGGGSYFPVFQLSPHPNIPAAPPALPSGPESDLVRVITATVMSQLAPWMEDTGKLLRGMEYSIQNLEAAVKSLDRRISSKRNEQWEGENDFAKAAASVHSQRLIKEPGVGGEGAISGGGFKRVEPVPVRTVCVRCEAADHLSLLQILKGVGLIHPSSEKRKHDKPKGVQCKYCKECTLCQRTGVLLNTTPCVDCNATGSVHALASTPKASAPTSLSPDVDVAAVPGSDSNNGGKSPHYTSPSTSSPAAHPTLPPPITIPARTVPCLSQTGPADCRDPLCRPCGRCRGSGLVPHPKAAGRVAPAYGWSPTVGLLAGVVRTAATSAAGAGPGAGSSGLTGSPTESPAGAGAGGAVAIPWSAGAAAAATAPVASSGDDDTQLQMTPLVDGGLRGGGAVVDSDVALDSLGRQSDGREDGGGGTGEEDKEAEEGKCRDGKRKGTLECQEEGGVPTAIGGEDLPLGVRPQAAERNIDDEDDDDDKEDQEALPEGRPATAVVLAVGMDHAKREPPPFAPQPPPPLSASSSFSSATSTTSVSAVLFEPSAAGGGRRRYHPQRKTSMLRNASGGGDGGGIGRGGGGSGEEYGYGGVYEDGDEAVAALRAAASADDATTTATTTSEVIMVAGLVEVHAVSMSESLANAVVADPGT
ncbi:hypothetical protein DFJ73DRAFT_800503 [Zopfochytrium polystomum]|nr:hypothetical protein DFJ73DRAFT_800503 [Zopfochytrium polystomum]